MRSFLHGYDSTEHQAKLIYGGKILYQWLPWDSVRDRLGGSMRYMHLSKLIGFVHFIVNFASK